MTAKAALCKALLDGKVLNVKNCFALIGLTNCSREISRMVEDDFDVKVSRTHRVGVSRYGQAVTWTDYRLNKTEYNRPGIEKMIEYVNKQAGTIVVRTDKEAKQLEEIFGNPKQQPLNI